MEMDFVGAFELEYGWIVDFSRIIETWIEKTLTTATELQPFLVSR